MSKVSFIETKFVTQAQSHLLQGNVAKMWKALADGGDAYAFAAYNVVSDQDNLVRSITEAYWQRVIGYGIGSEQWNKVAHAHAQTYLFMIDEKSKNSDPDHADKKILPDTHDIEESYLQAVRACGLPDHLVIDLALNSVTGKLADTIKVLDSLLGIDVDIPDWGDLLELLYGVDMACRVQERPKHETGNRAFTDATNLVASTLQGIQRHFL
jgi:hypothetical protein